MEQHHTPQSPEVATRPEIGHEMDLPPPRQLGKAALMHDVLVTPFDILTELAGEGSQEVRLSNYAEAMQKHGYSREEAIRELESLVSSGNAEYTQRYRIRLPRNSVTR